MLQEQKQEQKKFTVGEMYVKTAYIRGKILEDVNKARSTWDKGVGIYALELINDYTGRQKYNIAYYKTIYDISNQILLNGAENWCEYSYSGSALIYNSDICERLCPDSEIEQKKHGEKAPNKYETWLDVQVRALKQAARKILRYSKECDRDVIGLQGEWWFE